MLSVSDFNDFEVFAVVAQEGSLRGAAKRLGTSQPKVSQRVTRLERNLGFTLVDRSTTGIRLTDAGQRLLPSLRRALRLMNEAIDAVKDTAGTATLEVWTDPALALITIPFVARTLQHLPVVLSSREASADDAVLAVAQGDADVGFVHGEVDPSSLVVQPFFEDELCFVVGAGHPLTALPVVRVEDVIAYDVAVTMCAPGADLAVAHLTTAGIPPERLLRVTPATTAAMLAIQGDHVGACLRSSVPVALGLGIMEELTIEDLPNRRVEVSCVTRSSEHEPDVLRLIRDAVATAWERKTPYA